MTEPYGDTRRSVIRRPATPPGRCIVEHHHRHQLGTLSARPLVDRPPLCVRAGRAATSCKPSTTARWVDRKPSEPLPKLSPTPYTMQMDIGNDASNLCFGMVADPLRSMRPSWHNRRDWLWGALDREDGRKLDISLCMECSTYRYDTGEPSIAIRDPRDRPREPIACLGGYGRLRRKTPGWVKG